MVLVGSSARSKEYTGVLFLVLSVFSLCINGQISGSLASANQQMIFDPRNMTYEGAGLAITNDASWMMVSTPLRATSMIATSIYLRSGSSFLWNYEMPEFPYERKCSALSSQLDCYVRFDYRLTQATREIYVMGNYWHQALEHYIGSISNPVER